MFAVLMGLAWATAIGSMAYAISTLGVPVSIIAPLTNANALVALAVSSLVFREWATLNGPRVLAGTFLIVIGAMVVATSKD
jgi:transporter family protein